MKIVIIPSDYPDKKRNVYSFVKEFVDELARQGHDVYVISPISFFQYRRRLNYKERSSYGKGKVTVLRPLYITGRENVSKHFRQKAIAKLVRIIKPDVVYGHFWKNAYDGYKVAKELSIPLFVASGESDVQDQFPYSPKLKGFCDYVTGVICVSSKNKKESIDLGLTSEDKCFVAPNAINSNLFQKLDKPSCRKELNIPHDIFIVAFVGWFNERKGAYRVSEAIEKLGDEQIYSLFLGDGDLEPNCKNILIKGKVQHEKLPVYLNSADVFVLPTLKEGCCNAIIEAMACGLPVISSDRSFNWDVLNETNSILVEPDNIEQIAQAIRTIKQDSELRSSFSRGALDTTANLTIDNRTRGIVSFIENRINSIQ